MRGFGTQASLGWHIGTDQDLGWNWAIEGRFKGVKYIDLKNKANQK
jgi:hypothetical protein